MSGNTFGRLYCVTSFGESHGPAIGCVVDGCPPGLELSEPDIQRDLDRRKPGTSRHVTQRREPDRVEILSGVFEGKTTGTPIALLIRNEDQRSRDYREIAETFRPGHADYTYWQKYGIRDHRGGGRASARETAVRVAAGAIARQWLSKRFGIEVRGHMTALGDIEIPFRSWSHVHDNPFFAADPDVVPELEACMDRLRREGDSIGAGVRVVASGVPVGWGEPVYDRLDADIASAMMGINAVKGVEIGAGFASIRQRGSQHADELSPSGFLGNHAGGILGGISTGQDIEVGLAVKPTSSIRIPRRTIDKAGHAALISTEGRHDPCVGIRAVPVAEAMMLIVLMDHALRHRAQCADVRCPTPKIAPGTGGPAAGPMETRHDPEPEEDA
ncbi:MAG: chorismate synthase [Rhodocyclaceae bacterium]|jgi:chorismate synthase|nr:chorismate synthase [Rhodocyclaceae bacterium]MBK7813618.1 chorismate synthase [Rhodocyclaceae bacterium]MBK9310976.1 chorismate synthase [Rhodocyclaceae bacterium]